MCPVGGIKMNTNHVANLLGVSTSTVQRWVKHLNLAVHRNDLSHYVFSAENINELKEIQAQINNGILLQQIGSSAQPVYQKTDDKAIERLLIRINQMENRFDEKADSVVSYQLLQHRREIEELQEHINNLCKRIEDLESKQNQQKKMPSTDKLLVFDQKVKRKKKKQRTILSMLFGI
jgi:chromosome-anchoring protein RacA